MKQDKIIKTISLDRITYNALVDMAREDKRPLSQYIRVQLERVVENNKKESVIAKVLDKLDDYTLTV